jgi:hypothetical protein
MAVGTTDNQQTLVGHNERFALYARQGPMKIAHRFNGGKRTTSCEGAVEAAATLSAVPQGHRKGTVPLGFGNDDGRANGRRFDFSKM